MGVLNEIRFDEAVQVFGGGGARHIDAAGGGVAWRRPRRPSKLEEGTILYQSNQNEICFVGQQRRSLLRESDPAEHGPPIPREQARVVPLLRGGPGITF